MALPKLQTLTFPLTFPMSKKAITYRLYTVDDEKLLLSANAGKDDNPKFYVENTLKVIRGCINDTSGELETLAAVDVEYLLLQMRAKSVGETVDIKYRDPDSNKVFDVSLDLEKFFVDIDPAHNYKVELTDKVGLQMKDLTFTQKVSYAAKFNEKTKTDLIFETIYDCVVSIYDEDTVYVIGKDTTKEELKQFIGQLTGVSSKLYDFVATMPQLAINVVLPNGVTKKFTSNEVDFLALSPDT